MVKNSVPTQTHSFSKLAEELVGDFRQVAYDEPRRAIKRPTKNLSAIIEELMVKNQIGRPSAEQSIRDQWPALVGTANATYSHAARIERGRLIVLAASAGRLPSAASRRAHPSGSFPRRRHTRRTRSR